MHLKIPQSIQLAMETARWCVGWDLVTAGGDDGTGSLLFILALYMLFSAYLRRHLLSDTANIIPFVYEPGSYPAAKASATS
jgi:hypothetical protein